MATWGDEPRTPNGAARSSPLVAEEASRLDALFRSIELEANLLGSSTTQHGPTTGLAVAVAAPYDRRVVRRVEPATAAGRAADHLARTSVSLVGPAE